MGTHPIFESDFDCLTDETMTSTTGSTFSLAVRGQVASASLPQLAGMDVAVKYAYELGPDWQVASGMEEGFSQLVGSATHDFALNLPLDCTFKSTNPSGWPRLVMELIGPNFFGSDQPRGFCWAMVPPIAGSHTVETSVYVPKASSNIQSLSHWFAGTHVNFADPKQIARANGRELVRVESVGTIKVNFQITSTNLLKFGYSVGSKRT